MDSATVNADFAPFAAEMQAAELPQVFIDTFRFYYAQLVAGATGYIGHIVAGPVAHVPDYDKLGDAEEAAGRAALARTVVLKLGADGALYGTAGMRHRLPGHPVIIRFDGELSRKISDDTAPVSFIPVGGFPASDSS